MKLKVIEASTYTNLNLGIINLNKVTFRYCNICYDTICITHRQYTSIDDENPLECDKFAFCPDKRFATTNFRCIGSIRFVQKLGWGILSP